MIDMKGNDTFQYEYYSAVKQRKIDWLWYPYIPYGKLTVVQGDPGEGKSTFMLNVAALLTKGGHMPDGYPIPIPQNVVYQTGEDNIADTVKPRLLSAGADCGRVAYIVDDDAPLTLDDDRIEKVLQQTGARLFILDPLQAYLSQDSDMFSAGRMRQLLKRLADLGATYNCAIVIIGHMNKASREKHLYRGLGSIDIAAIARSVLMISRDKDDPDVRYMFPVKSSLAPQGSAIAFSLVPRRGLVWLGQAAINADHYEDAAPEESKHSLARRIVIEMLEERDTHSKDLFNKLKCMGVSERTANTVKKELGISSYKKDGVWFWHMDHLPTIREVANAGK